ncbi:hypothetical protein BZA05DRAFT_441038 [Tricharina praecox]|uniref:uncharacterized protein n=1 Tax=Tricharina praecox TaxID=43433 RepID=UPI00221F57C8|nr:uncharacterized protein BZA05DRAFT_441038 [Tricharina praecox]KAI5857730.1 hypothetical protein BZA05DRAFT_441038 [Tricharina praecox]
MKSTFLLASILASLSLVSAQFGFPTDFTITRTVAGTPTTTSTTSTTPTPSTSKPSTTPSKPSSSSSTSQPPPPPSTPSPSTSTSTSTSSSTIPHSGGTTIIATTLSTVTVLPSKPVFFPLLAPAFPRMPAKAAAVTRI